MALDDLDLEFEDEEEAKKKKNEAVQVDVDLEFQAPEGGGKPRPVVRPAAPGGPAERAAGAAGEVRKLDEARGAPAARRPGVVAPRAQGAAALKSLDDVEASEVVELRQKVQQVEFDASVKVANAEYKMELLSEVLSDVKLLDHQIGQLLTRIVAKHAENKQEALLIKKLLADFIAKKRK